MPRAAPVVNEARRCAGAAGRRGVGSGARARGSGAFTGPCRARPKASARLHARRPARAPAGTAVRSPEHASPPPGGEGQYTPPP